MPHPSDYKVTTRFERQLAADAESLRQLLGVDNRLEFDPFRAISFFEQYEVPRKGVLKVHFFDAPKGCPLARVKYKPLRLMVDKEIWEAAKDGDPIALYILAHEIGHIVEHDDTAKAFSSNETLRLKAFPNEERAEWQADKFADHLVLPWKFITAYKFEVQDICALCNVELSVVKRQIAALKSSKRYVGDMCPECANFTLVRNGTCLKCETCGSTTASN